MSCVWGFPKRWLAAAARAGGRLLLVLAALAAAPSFAATSVVLTVDVESFRDGDPELQVWGRVVGGEHGITRIMRLLETHGFRGTFFLTPYESARFGEAPMREAAREIVRRGHDLQLHTHPWPMYGIARMEQAPYEQQVLILKKGLDLIESWTGVRPVVHRAGAFGANLDTLRAVRAAGMLADASYAPGGARRALEEHFPPVNDPIPWHGLLELPVSFYVQARIGPWWESRRLVDIEAAELEELVAVTEQAVEDDAPLLTVLMHSFSFVRSGQVDERVAQRFSDYLAYLEDKAGVEVVTARELVERWSGEPPSGRGAVPYTGWWLTYVRAVRRWDEGWKNAAVALSPVVPVMLAGLAMAARARRSVWSRRRVVR